MSLAIKVGIARPLFLTALLFGTLVHAESLDEVMDGFDDEPATKQVEVSKVKVKDSTEDLMDGFDDEPKTKKDKTINSAQDKNGKLLRVGILKDITGKVTQQVTYSYASDAEPHDDISSFKSSLFLDYEHKFENGYKVKVNGKAYYDSIYDIRGEEKYSNDELDELQSEVELFDAYVEGSLADNLDFKIGRQVVVWGRSDTIRVTDILNPIDNRRPGMVDIEDLRLPVTMAKFDYFVDDWRITPMAILEQRFSKNPPSGSAFNPNPHSIPSDKSYSDVTPALSVGGEFSGWDVNFYAAQTRDDAGYVQQGKMQHDKVNMVGTAVNVLKDSWLLKSEVAHFDGLKYTSTQNKEFSRTDMLVGLEYNGFADTMVSYDVALKNLHNYDARLKNEPQALDERNYQHAFRVSKEFMNATIKGNYLISLFGSKADQGGFQRAWAKYDIADGIYANVGLVDYIGGSKRFDTVKDNDLVFADLTYSF